MKLNYDKKVDALYISFSKGKIFNTAKISPGILVDQGRGSKILGVEILDASKRLNFKKNNRSIQIPIALTA